MLAEVGGDDPTRPHHVCLDDVQKAERPGTDYHHGVARIETLDRVGRELLQFVEGRRAGHELGENSDAWTQARRNFVDERVRTDVHLLGPATHQMRGIGGRIGVSVAIAVLAPHVSHDVCAFVTRAAHDVGAHRDAIPDLQWSTVEL